MNRVLEKEDSRHRESSSLRTVSQGLVLEEKLESYAGHRLCLQDLLPGYEWVIIVRLRRGEPGSIPGPATSDDH